MTFFSSARVRVSTFYLPFLFAAWASLSLQAAPRSRVNSVVDSTRMKQLAVSPPRQAQPQLDQGAVDPTMPMSYMLVMFKPSAEQQADLDQLLFDQQNPSSANFHKWLRPEEYANRFGLSASDSSKVTAWLVSQGLKVEQTARGGNWIAFSGNAGQVSTALRTHLCTTFRWMGRSTSPIPLLRRFPKPSPR